VLPKWISFCLWCKGSWTNSDCSSVSTKIPILLGHDFWIFHLPKASRYGRRPWQRYLGGRSAA
jgi:hypothetical protein